MNQFIETGKSLFLSKFINFNLNVYVFALASQIIMLFILLDGGRLWAVESIKVGMQFSNWEFIFWLPYIALSLILKRSSTSNVILSLSLVGIFVFITSTPLGDDWAYQSEVQPGLWSSEIFGSLYAKAIYQWEMPWLSYLFKPLIGTASVFLFLRLLDSLIDAKWDSFGGLFFRRVLIIGGTWTLTLFQGDGDVLFFTYPFLFIFLESLVKMWEGKEVTPSSYAILGLSYACLIFSHMGALVLAPAIPIIFLLKSKNSDKINDKPILQSVTYIFTFTLLIYLFLLASGNSIVAGNVGAHSLVWSVLKEKGLSYFTYDYIGRGANIFLVAFPLFPIVTIIEVKKHLFDKGVASERFLFILLVNAYISFIYLVNFYFGYHRDIDLMIYLSPIFIISSTITLIKGTELGKLTYITRIFLGAICFIVSYLIQASIIHQV